MRKIDLIKKLNNLAVDLLSAPDYIDMTPYALGELRAILRAFEPVDTSPILTDTDNMHFVQAVKHYRDATRCGLREAVDAVKCHRNM